ncbi:c-type cytochrome [Roseivivax sediminis]|uniref:Cytochrome c domain-containing protein n=1 Tax=Roseivivax sediminis TaxID=936889 RepID=A0A1I1SL02_9RHOB|nr:c-type cytochrome [Roseivivax sediminis]SFD47137.1 hypothetical protein SAMN04515678_101217 [Roseivivax sediminis]
MRRAMILAAALSCGSAGAQEDSDRRFRLAVPEALVDSGLIDYLAPRFSLKTATQVVRVAPGAAADARFGAEGAVVFEGPERAWHLDTGDDPDAAAFADWLRSDIGRRTVESYEVAGRTPFSAETRPAKAETGPVPDGDASEGATLAKLHCGRCHVVDDADRMGAIGSTPSFSVLRTFPDWAERFAAFYALNPHPAFTQIDEVTAPFAAHQPSPIVPLEMTLDELDDIVAYVGAIPPADLGAPIEAR